MSPPDLTKRNPGPWHFHVRMYGFAHVIVDGERRYMVSGVPFGSGPLLAAGPELLDALERVVESTNPGSAAHEIAIGTIENFREREAMVLVSWKPEPLPPARPQMRIVGVAV